MTNDARRVAEELFGELERSWNAGDGAAFARPFTANADFVDVRGMHHTSSAAIGAGHQAIFDSVYRGSTVRYSVTGAREIAPGCILAHATAVLEVPAGPLQGTRRAIPSIVAVQEEGTWRITAFHNTPVAE